MAKKKTKQKQDQVIGKAINTTAVINQLTVSCHQDKISLTSLSLSGVENEIITDMIKNESDVLLKIELPAPDKDFPPISVKGKLKVFKISKTCDTPNLINIQFSSDQVHQLTNYIRAEQEVSLEFIEAEPELDFEAEPELDFEATEITE